MSQIRAILNDQRNAILQQIHNLVLEGRQPRKAEELSEIYIDLEKSLREINAAIEGTYSTSTSTPSAIKPTQPGKYASFPGRPIGAIVHLLTKRNTPMTEANILNTLCREGFRGGGAQARLMLVRSLRNFTNGTGSKGKAKDTLQRINDYIGLGEWESDRFPAS